MIKKKTKATAFFNYFILNALFNRYNNVNLKSDLFANMSSIIPFAY
ncbi:hypothetical protein A6A12_0949 [Vibrio anguillarum]|nr:hypothetical protein A6A12_0949 [Vibrio anguillarum]